MAKPKVPTVSTDTAQLAEVLRPPPPRGPAHPRGARHPPEPWWTLTLASGSPIRRPAAPPAGRGAPAAIAMPTAYVCTSGFTNGIAS